MFYSHEILKNPEHGVSTIWLVATAGLKTRISTVTRKAVQEVNIQKACETIIKPGVPIALRLQSNLLYGVSRVFSQQCNYILSDAEKVQSRMRAFTRRMSFAGTSLDPSAGKASRDQLILVDDPEFNLDFAIPPLPPMLLEGDENGYSNETQKSRKTSSQMSPLVTDDMLLELSLNPAEQIGWNLGSSSKYGNPFQLDPGDSLHSPALLGRSPSSVFSQGRIHSKAEADIELGFDDAFDNQPNNMNDLGLEIDEHGNILETRVDSSPELPPMPGSPAAHLSVAGQPPNPLAAIDDGDDISTILGEDEFPQAGAFVTLQEGGQDITEQTFAEFMDAVAPSRRQRRGRLLAPDEETRISRDEYKLWTENYVANQEQARARAKRQTNPSAAQAKKNAWNTIFGVGIMGVGMLATHSGYDHPLAREFAGEGLEQNLFAIALGRPVNSDDRNKDAARSASDALSEDENEVGRKKRPRLGKLELEGENKDDELVHDAQQKSKGKPTFDQEEPERGRDDPILPPDVGSDILPWNRSSFLLGSDTGKPKAFRLSSLSSPLQNRDSVLPSIERFSDQALPSFGSDGFGPYLGGAEDSFEALGKGGDTNMNNISQAVLSGLDQHGRNFLDYLEAVAHEHGSPQYNSKAETMHWIDFDALFPKHDDYNTEVAAQAFYQILGLVTKNIIKVEQTGQGGTEAFGQIRVGVKVSSAAKGKGKLPATVSSFDLAGGSQQIGSSPPLPHWGGGSEEMGSSPPLPQRGDEIEGIKQAYQSYLEQEDEEGYEGEGGEEEEDDEVEETEEDDEVAEEDEDGYEEEDEEGYEGEGEEEEEDDEVEQEEEDIYGVSD